MLFTVHNQKTTLGFGHRSEVPINLKAEASCRRPKNIEKCKNIKNENCQKHVILEGFRQNGLQIRIQRNFLRISTPVKIDFRHFLENDIFFT